MCLHFKRNWKQKMLTLNNKNFCTKGAHFPIELHRKYLRVFQLGMGTIFQHPVTIYYVNAKVCLLVCPSSPERITDWPHFCIEIVQGYFLHVPPCGRNSKLCSNSKEASKTASLASLKIFFFRNFLFRYLTNLEYSNSI